jgi:hypothetical protein
MKKLLRVFLAAWGAKKTGGGKCGCIGTIFVFIFLYIILGPILNML